MIGFSHQLAETEIAAWEGSLSEGVSTSGWPVRNFPDWVNLNVGGAISCPWTEKEKELPASHPMICFLTTGTV